MENKQNHTIPCYDQHVLARAALLLSKAISPGRQAFGWLAIPRMNVTTPRQAFGWLAIPRMDVISLSQPPTLLGYDFELQGFPRKEAGGAGPYCVICCLG